MSNVFLRLRNASLVSAVALALGACHPPGKPVEVNIAAINDFHGNLTATPFTYADASAPGGKVTLKAGGINALSGVIGELRKSDPHLLLVGAGDMIGGSPPMSAMWADEPTLTALGTLGLKFSVIGNHELDQGTIELQRQINGGCDSPRPEKACVYSKDYTGTRFPYVAANLMDAQTGKPLFPAYRIEEANGAKIAFVGAVLNNVSAYVSTQSMNGLYAIDEAEAINAQLPALHKLGVDAIVAVIHQGGETVEPYDQTDCSQLKGDIIDVANRLAPEIKVVITAHTHQGYLCRLGDKLVTQGSSFGRLVTHLTLTVDPVKHQLLDAKAQNILADPNRYPPLPQIAAQQAEVEARSHEHLSKPIARMADTQVKRTLNAAGESAMGDLVSDAQLKATRSLGAQVAFINLGGIRADLILEPGQEQLTYSQVASVQPFNNTLNILTLSGAQLKQLLEQQWQNNGFGFYPLQPSASLSYRWDPSMPQGQRIIASSMHIDGMQVVPEMTYQVTVNSFMAGGGDNFTVFKDASERLDTGLNDLDALIDYLQVNDRAGEPVGQLQPQKRIQQVETRLTNAAASTLP